MQLAFGAGALWGNRTDVIGSGIGPNQFGILQDVQIDWDWTIKELWGQFQFPVDIARGQGKITGKAKFARIFGAIYGDLFFGQTPAIGQLTVAENEAGTVPSTPFQITVTNAANFSDDLGVYYASGASAGNRFTRVTSPSAAGQYSVNLTTGVYTFTTADTGAALLISYLYTISASGKKLAITNQFAGYTPTFKATFFTTKATGGVSAGRALVLNACTASKLAIPTKIDDYEIQEFDFSAFADAAGNIGTLSINE